MSAPRWIDCIAHRVLPLLAEGYIRLAGATTSVITEENPQSAALEAQGKNFIYAAWHCQQLMLIYTHRGRRACALVSMSRDGEYAARILERFGFAVARGSTSKGGTQALLALIDKAQQGWHPVITPDGPRGPARTVSPGVVFLAQKTGLPVVPIACGLKRKLTFNSWDRFMLPLPFGKAAVVWGSPVAVSESDDPAEAAAKIQRGLDAASARAERLAAE
ncbi:MAG: lysophospholipid acyltransferase family protein [Elusimicrobiales bacterium]